MPPVSRQIPSEFSQQRSDDWRRLRCKSESQGAVGLQGSHNFRGYTAIWSEAVSDSEISHLFGNMMCDDCVYFMIEKGQLIMKLSDGFVSNKADWLILYKK